MNLRTFLILLSTTLSASCGQSVDEIKTQSPEEIEFRIHEPLTTKAGKTIFSIGDSIGIYAVKRTNPNTPATPGISGNQAHNAKWIYTEKGWKPASPIDKIVWPQESAAIDFYAYYPYQRNIANPDSIVFNINKDQRLEKDFLHSDILYATNTSGLTEGTVDLQFKHILSLVEVKISTGNGALDGAEMSLQANEIATDIFFNIGTGAYTLGEKNKAVFYQSPVLGVFQIVLPPQEIAAGTKFLQFDMDGSTFIHTTEGLIKLETGSKQNIEITLK